MNSTMMNNDEQVRLDSIGNEISFEKKKKLIIEKIFYDHTV